MEQGLRRLTAVLLLTGIAAAACDSPSESGERRQVAVISHYGDGPEVTAPDTVPRATPFVVSVRTYGNGCVSQGDVEVESVPGGAAIRPYDIHSGDVICTDILHVFQHEATIVLTEAGRNRLVVHGRGLPSDSLIVVERLVWVR